MCWAKGKGKLKSLPTFERDWGGEWGEDEEPEVQGFQWTGPHQLFSLDAAR